LFTLSLTVPFHWDIVGAGPFEPALRRLIDRSEIANNVTLHNLVDDQSLDKLFIQADFHAMIPIEIVDEKGLGAEGFGLVYLEAAKHCRASLGSRTGAAAEVIVDGVTGILVDPHSETELVAALECLLRSKSLCAAGRIASSKTTDETIAYR
jgi:phosphatidylinositol alpha-1,6-mannosyltransferase